MVGEVDAGDVPKDVQSTELGEACVGSVVDVSDEDAVRAAVDALPKAPALVVNTPSGGRHYWYKGTRGSNAGVVDVMVIRRDPLSGTDPLAWPWLDKQQTFAELSGRSAVKKATYKSGGK